MDLVQEILLKPRWDADEFARIKTKTINQIKRSDADPNSVAEQVYNKILYGENHIFAYPTSGTEASVEAITMDDLKAFYAANFSPSISKFNIVGKESGFKLNPKEDSIIFKDEKVFIVSSSCSTFLKT